MKLKLKNIVNISSYLRLFKFILEKIEIIFFGKIEAISVKDYVNIKIIKIFTSHTFYMPELKDIEGNNNVKPYSAKVPQSNVNIIKNGIFIPGSEEIYTSDLKVLNELTAQKINLKKGLSKRRIKEYKKINGKILCLSMSGLERSYYHFTIEYLARWYLFAKSNLKYDYIDYDEKNQFQRDLFKLLDIPERKKIPKHFQNVPIQANELIVPDFINNWEEHILPNGRIHCMKQYLPNWFDQVHKNLRQKSNSSVKRIYISRSKVYRRKIANEDDIIKLISNYGFRVFYMEDLDLDKQISLFNNAEVIISAHGAALSNIVYCSSTFKLLEIFPKNYFDSSYRILTRFLKCDYNYLVGESINNSNLDPQKENIYVNCEKLKKWLIKLDT